MARKFRPLTPELAEKLPDMCLGCVFWESAERLEARCGAETDVETAKGWIAYVNAQWGDCGRVVVEDGEVLGVIKYAPPAFLPQAALMPAGPPTGDAPLIACMHIVPEARQHGFGKVLMQAALRDLVQRGERAVEAYGVAGQVDYAHSPMVGVEFLLRLGFTVVRPHPDMPLMRMDLRSLAVWREDLESVLDSLRMPLRVARRVPEPWVGSR
ncbi:MAG: GNAT family N-acetyltransferase [Actinobacteria bacterium]|nr:MAG: GNAT family N-acetyltransferase [Actinomycetota bacterium]